MQSAQKHVDAQEGKAGHRQARQRPPGRHGAAQALHQAHVQPGGVVEPDDQRPGLFRVPAPVAAPGLGRPQRAQHGGDGEKGKTDGDGLVHHVVQHFKAWQTRGNALAAQQNAAHNQARNQQVTQPVAAASFQRRLCETPIGTKHSTTPSSHSGVSLYQRVSVACCLIR